MLIGIAGLTDSGIGQGGSHVHIQNVEVRGLDIAFRPGGDRWIIEGCRTISTAWAVFDGLGTLFTWVHHNMFERGSGGRIQIDFSVGWRIESNMMASSIEGHPDHDVVISDNTFLISSPADEDAAIFIGGDNGAEQISVIDNHLYDLTDRGIHLANVINSEVNGNTVSSDVDGIVLSGTSSENMVTMNRIIPVVGQTQFGIDVVDATCSCNVVAGNMLGDPADYTADALNDAGTDTQLTWPNNPTYGDNFTVCVPTS